mgnify:CR=1 FL=1
MVKRPTINDLALAAGVSVATVDRVLNKRHPVRRDTASRVLTAAESLGFYATGLIRQRVAEAPQRTFSFLLQKRSDVFYQALGEGLAGATRAALDIRGTAIVEFMDELVPATIAERLRAAGLRSDAVAVVAVDHPHVTAAIEELSARGVPVFTLLSDLTAPSRAGYIGCDDRKRGRTAAWTIARTGRAPSTIGVLVGSHRYLGQELAEISFRSYFREKAPDFRVLETLVNLEDPRIAYEAVLDLLAAHRDLGGIYVAGGGMEGVIRAVRDEGMTGRIVVVCNELKPETREALVDGTVDMVLSTPIPMLAARVVEAMIGVLGRSAIEGVRQIFVPAELYISENV